MKKYIPKNLAVDAMIASYTRIKDETWPDCADYSDFEKLPKHIVDECKDVHGVDFLMDRSKLRLLNPYYPGAPFEVYTDLDDRLAQQFNYIYDTHFPFSVSPRFFYQSGIKFTIRDTYWYIDQLYKSNPSSVIDLGCGENEFKNWFPNITGIDICDNPWSQADIIGHIDDDFFNEHQGKYDCGMCIHSVWPNGWRILSGTIHSMMGLVKDSFFFASVLRPEVLPDLPLELRFNTSLLLTTIINIIYDLGYDVTLMDLPDSLTMNWETSWGGVTFRKPPHSNLRFILKHKKQ